MNNIFYILCLSIALHWPNIKSSTIKKTLVYGYKCNNFYHRNIGVLCYSQYKNIIQNQENHKSRKLQTATQHIYYNYIARCINFLLALEGNHQGGCLQNLLLITGYMLSIALQKNH